MLSENPETVLSEAQDLVETLSEESQESAKYYIKVSLNQFFESLIRIVIQIICSISLQFK